MNAKRKSSLTWSRVKKELSALEEADVLRLLHDPYGARPENRDFMHARLRLAEVDSLEPYKKHRTLDFAQRPPEPECLCDKRQEGDQRLPKR